MNISVLGALIFICSITALVFCRIKLTWVGFFSRHRAAKASDLYSTKLQNMYQFFKTRAKG